MRILFITATRVGDAILSSGLLDHFIARHPGARVTVACGPAAAGLFEAVPGLERLVVLDKMVASLHWLQLWSVAALRLWDVVVDLRNSPLGIIAPARQRFRLGRLGRGPGHRVQQMAAVLGLGHAPPAPKLWMAPRHAAIAERLIPPGGPVLAVGPTANWRAKTWRSERFAELIGRLTAPTGILPGARVAIFGRDDERAGALRLIESIAPEQRLDLVGSLDLLDVFACFKRCALYVGNDSGLMHLAAASAIPTLGLFGPSREERYAPWGPNCRVVRTSVPFESIFPENFDHRASDSLMDSLTVEAAAAAAAALWAETAAARAANTAPAPAGAAHA